MIGRIREQPASSSIQTALSARAWITDETQDIRALLLRQDTRLFFSSVSVLEIAIKHSLKPEAMPCTACAVYADAIASGIEEMPFVSRHAQGVGALPWGHRDPFDRILVAQARTEGMVLLSHDGDVIRYGDGVKGF